MGLEVQPRFAIFSLMRRYALFSVTAVLLLLTVNRDSLAAGISFVSPRIGVASGVGFCTHGAYPQTSWPEPPPPGIYTWGFYCSDRESGRGTLVTSPFVASRSLWLYLAGYTSNSGLALEIERISDHSRFVIRPSREPHEVWLLSEFSLPANWRGSLVRLVATDQNTGPGGWLAFSEPVQVSQADAVSAVLLASETIFHFVLLLLPALAVCACILHKRVRSTLTAGLVLLAGIGAAGYLIFWCYFFSPRLGYLVALALPVISVAFLVLVGRHLDSGARRVLATLIPPVALTGVVAVLVLSVGFLYGGMQDPLHTASVRFSHQLPIDNTLPYSVARGLLQGHIPKPLFADWLTSDRPPLQSGIVLSQEPFGHPGQIGYTVISVIAQSLWIFGLWLLLDGFGVKRWAIVAVLATCLFSGFVFLNSFFVWPKLLAAAFTFGFFAVLFSKEQAFGLLEKRVRFVCAGALLSLGMLSHGGTIFAVIGAVIAFVALRKRLSLASIALIVGVAAGVYLPWMMFQKFVDPPGNRLLKMHLAGVEPIDNRSFGEALVSAYRGLTLRQIIDHKLENAKRALGSGWESDYWRGVGRIASDLSKGDYVSALPLANDRRTAMFYSFVLSLGFLPYALFALLAGVKRRFRTVEWRTAATLLLLVTASLVGWWVLMFGPGTTIIVSGAYAVDLLAMTACILVLWPLSPWLTVTVSALQVALNVLLYVVLMRGFVPGGPLPEGHLHPDMLALCLIALGVVVGCLILVAKDTRATSSDVQGPIREERIASRT